MSEVEEETPVIKTVNSIYELIDTLGGIITSENDVIIDMTLPEYSKKIRVMKPKFFGSTPGIASPPDTDPTISRDNSDNSMN